MRVFIGALALSLLAACQLTLAPLPDSYQNCGHDSRWSGSQCDPVSIITVITIGPSRQYSNNADAMCYQFSPAVVSVKIGGSYSFQNNTSSSITILGSDQSTWVTVGAYSTSTSLTFSAAGAYSFAVQGCRGLSGTPWYGVLNVTIN